MKTFHVFVHPVHGMEAVKAGFSWPAFLFAVPWMLEKQLWSHAAVWFTLYSVTGALRVMAGANGAMLALIAWLSLGLTAGMNANRWCEKQLERAKYKPLRTVVAPTAYEALEDAFAWTRRSAHFQLTAARS